MNKNNNGKSLLIYLLVSVVIIGGLVYFLTSMSSNNTSTKYSEIMGHFDNLGVSEFELDLGSGKMKYKLKDSDEVKNYTVLTFQYLHRKFSAAKTQKTIVENTTKLIPMIRLNII